MKEAMVGIVIVNYNGHGFQNECIESILNTGFSKFKLIIVDNCSQDDSMKELEKFQDNRIVKILNDDNYGVAKGNNIGIKKSIELGCDYTLLLNNDTIVTKNFFENLLKNKEEKVIVHPILYYNSNLLWYGGGKIVKHKCNAIHLNYKKIYTNVEYRRYYDYAPTCSMLIKNEVFEKVGFMDERYFLYCDDTDFCMRLKLNGIKLYFEKTALIYHKVSLSTGGENSDKTLYYCLRNRLFFAEKYLNYFGKFNFFIVKYYYIFKSLYSNKKYLYKKAYKDYKENKMGRCDNI